MTTDRPAPAIAAEAWLEMVRQLLSGDAGTLPLDAAERAERIAALVRRLEEQSA